MVMYANPPDLPEMLVWRRALRDDGLFVDVGANAGTYTLWAAELGTEIIALEPAAGIFKPAPREHRAQRVRAAAGDDRGPPRFTADLDAGNSLAPDEPVLTDSVRSAPHTPGSPSPLPWPSP
jgi:FkbM family methyltransferase